MIYLTPTKSSTMGLKALQVLLDTGASIFLMSLFIARDLGVHKPLSHTFWFTKPGITRSSVDRGYNPLDEGNQLDKEIVQAALSVPVGPKRSD